MKKYQNKNEKPKKSYIGSNGEDWKLLHQKNGIFWPFFGLKPSKKSKLDYADQIFCVISLTGHIWDQKNSLRHSTTL